MVFDHEGNAFSPGYSIRKSKKTRKHTYYYVNQKGLKHGVKACAIPRIRRDELENIVVGRIKENVKSWEQKNLFKGWKGMSFVERRKVLKILINRIIICPDKIKMSLHCLDGSGGPQEEVLPFKFQKSGNKKLILDEKGKPLSPQKTNKDPALIKALVRAHKWGAGHRCGKYIH